MPEGHHICVRLHMSGDECESKYTLNSLSPPLSLSVFFKCLALAPRRRRGSARYLKNTESERGGEREMSVYLDSHSSPLICNRTHMWCPSGMYLWAAPLTTFYSPSLAVEQTSRYVGECCFLCCVLSLSLSLSVHAHLLKFSEYCI